MSLLKMSIYGSVMIMAVIILRSIFIHRLPKRTFYILWGLVLIRLIVPFRITSPLSVYSLIPNRIISMEQKIEQTIDPAEEPTVETGTGDAAEVKQDKETVWMNRSSETENAEQIRNPISSHPASNLPSLWKTVISTKNIVWCIGMVISLCYFLFIYIKYYKEFQMSFPVSSEQVDEWLMEHPINRKIRIRTSGVVASPLTYGVFHPTILFPKTMDFTDRNSLNYVLEHEYVHIKRNDLVLKYFMVAAVFLHWFNPLVWIMYLLFNRDIELSCDEMVVRHFGLQEKSSYAYTLIDMEVKKAGLCPFYSGFSKNIIQERITAIMKIKKVSVITMIAMVLVVGGIVVAFSTSAATKTEPEKQVLEPSMNTNVKESVEQDASEDMMADTTESIDDMAEGWASDLVSSIFDSLDSSADGEDDEQWVQMIMKAVEKEWDSLLAPYVPLGVTYEFTDGHQEDMITIYYNGEKVRGIIDKVNGTIYKENRKDKEHPDDTIVLFAIYKNDKLSDLRKATEEEIENFESQSNDDNYYSASIDGWENSDETFNLSTKQDYESLLTLKADDYKKMTVADFNKSVAKWIKDNPDRWERIEGDDEWEQRFASVTKEDDSFVNVTVKLSAQENEAAIGTNGIKQDPQANVALQSKSANDDSQYAYCYAWFEYSYHIADAESTTVEKRDETISSFLQDIQTFWDEKSLDELTDMSKKDITSMIQASAKKYSDEKISIHVKKKNINFETEKGSKI